MSLENYIVILSELVDGEHQPECTFECQAEDFTQAIKQAQNAYPRCKVSVQASYGQRWFIKSGGFETVDWDCDNTTGFTIQLDEDDSSHPEPESDETTYKVEEWRNGDIVDQFYAGRYGEIRGWIGMEHQQHCAWRYSMRELCELWNTLADVSVTEQGELDEPFLFFPKGVSRETVWHWFEATNPKFQVGLAGKQIGPDHPFMNA